MSQLSISALLGKQNRRDNSVSPSLEILARVSQRVCVIVASGHKTWNNYIYLTSWPSSLSSNLSLQASCENLKNSNLSNISFSLHKNMLMQLISVLADSWAQLLPAISSLISVSRCCRDSYGWPLTLSWNWSMSVDSAARRASKFRYRFGTWMLIGNRLGSVSYLSQMTARYLPQVKLVLWRLALCSMAASRLWIDSPILSMNLLT